MSATIPPSPASVRLLRVLDRTALISVLLTPPLLLHAHGFAEAATALAALCFLARSALLRDWGWVRTPWLCVGWVWWLWLVFCSLPLGLIGIGEGGGASLGQALMAVRFLIILAAMEHAILRTAASRAWMFGLVVASTLYIAVQCVIQFLVGYNLYGEPPAFGDTLTGPFGKPRAGPPLSRMLPPALLPAVAALLARGSPRFVAGAYALLFAGMAVMVLIGQRIPVVLTGFALAIAALLLRPMRPVVVMAALATVLLLTALPVVSPPTYHRLVTVTTAQLENFPTSAYGKLYTRALEIGVQNPLTGLGFNGFRTGCTDPRYFRPTWDGREKDGGGAAVCWVHPHNAFAQALVDSGFIGLGLFTALGVAWLAALGRDLWRHPDPLRVGLFATTAAQLWPIQSSSGFYTLPVAGWFFLLLGWGLAEARQRATPPA